MMVGCEMRDDGPLFAWRPAPRVLPFPLARRRDLVVRTARRMTDLRPEKAEEHLKRTAALQSDVLARRGIEADEIARNRDAFIAAVRVEFARYGRRTGGGAA